MSTIIKATDRNKAVQTVAFNFDDMAASANQYIQKIRGEAAKIVAEAQKEADALKKKAEAEGRREGMAAIDQMAEQRTAKELSTLKPALLQAVEEIRHAKQAWLRHWEKSAIHTAAAIAARLVRRELLQTPEIAITLVREALELAAGSAQLKIRLNPADPASLPGGCRVETRFGVIDQQFEAQLARIEEELV